jgi:predicted lipoprotein with Yx(FWY)xxD motif
MAHVDKNTTYARRTPVRCRLLSGLAIAALVLAACGDDSDDTETEAADEVPEDTADDTPDTEAEPEGETVQTVSSDLGEILADDEGFSLYGFTQDSDGVSSCYDDCAETWPPLTVDGEELPEDLDPSVFSTSERTDGTFQVVAGDWPLYRFQGDAEPGDTNGQGVADVWFVVTPEGELVGDAGDADTGGDY